MKDDRNSTFFVSKGFTLVELLLVITILGILASIAIPRFFPQTEKARVSEAVGILSAIRAGEEAYFLENGEYFTADGDGNDAAWAPLGMDNPELDSADFDYDVTTSGSPPSAFTATATHTSCGSVCSGGDTITIDDTGTWGGAHPYVPSN